MNEYVELDPQAVKPEAWSVRDVGEDGPPYVDLPRKVIHVPLGTEPRHAAVRAHELGHVQFSRAKDKRFFRLPEYNAIEDARVNMLLDERDVSVEESTDDVARTLEMLYTTAGRVQSAEDRGRGPREAARFAATIWIAAEGYQHEQLIKEAVKCMLEPGDLEFMQGLAQQVRAGMHDPNTTMRAVRAFDQYFMGQVGDGPGPGQGKAPGGDQEDREDQKEEKPAPSGPGPSGLPPSGAGTSRQREETPQEVAKRLIEQLSKTDPKDLEKWLRRHVVQRRTERVRERNFDGSAERVLAGISPGGGTPPPSPRGGTEEFWGQDVRVERLPLTVPQKGAVKLLRKKRATDTGAVMRYPHRYFTDKAIFARDTKQDGGTVIIDLSGSMEISTGDVLDIIAALPSVTVIGYYGYQYYCRRGGDILILAENGRAAQRIPRRDCHNVIDYPALKWVTKKYPGPYYFVTDGKFTVYRNREERTLIPGGAREAEINGLLRRHSVKRFKNVDELRVHLGRRRGGS
jgi:hypothetical protein